MAFPTQILEKEKEKRKKRHKKGQTAMWQLKNTDQTLTCWTKHMQTEDMVGEGRRVEPCGTANLSLSWVGFISLIYTQDENWGEKWGCGQYFSFHVDLVIIWVILQSTEFTRVWAVIMWTVEVWRSDKYILYIGIFYDVLKVLVYISFN